MVIKADVEKKLNKKQTRCSYGIIDKIISAIICVILAIACVVSLITSCMGNNVVKDTSVIKVVYSSSMCAKYEKNEYLFVNDLNDHFSFSI